MVCACVHAYTCFSHLKSCSEVSMEPTVEVAVTRAVQDKVRQIVVRVASNQRTTKVPVEQQGRLCILENF